MSEVDMIKEEINGVRRERERGSFKRKSIKSGMRK